MPAQPLVILLLLGLMVTGCSAAASAPAVPDRVPAPDPMVITVSPADGKTDVRPTATVRVRSSNGALADVEVTTSDGAELAGEFSGRRHAWTATEQLDPFADYTVSVAGVDLRLRPVRKVTEFSIRRIPAAKRLEVARIDPRDGSKVGVGQPIAVHFNRPVANRKRVQAALTVTSDPSVVGAWYWIDDWQVHYRPKKFWPAGTQVEVAVDLRGVRAGEGMWGAENEDVSFTIGRRQVIKINLAPDVLQGKVIRGGEVIRRFPVSGGKPGWETRSGTHVIMAKVRDKKWTDEAIDADADYTLYSEYAMRITNSGEFLHGAPWALGALGEVNSSHGCTRMHPDDIRWLYKRTLLGDPVITTGTEREDEHIWNLYADWNVKWKIWSAGNADRTSRDPL